MGVNQMNERFKKRLKDLRKSKKLTQRDVSKLLNLPQHTTYANWERGTRTPPAYMIGRLAALYNIPCMDLFMNLMNDQERNSDK